MKYRNVLIVADVPLDGDSYPENANAEFPHLAEYVEDEADRFIARDDGQFWPARHFFSMVEIREFETP